jgi:hypothetical protein
VSLPSLRVPVPYTAPLQPAPDAPIQEHIEYDNACFTLRQAIEVAMYRRLNQQRGTRATAAHVPGLGVAVFYEAAGCWRVAWHDHVDVVMVPEQP